MNGSEPGCISNVTSERPQGHASDNSDHIVVSDLNGVSLGPVNPKGHLRWFRAAGITAYVENGGTIENAQAIANYESLRTAKLYDLERIAI